MNDLVYNEIVASPDMNWSLPLELLIALMPRRSSPLPYHLPDWEMCLKPIFSLPCACLKVFVRQTIV